MEEDLAVLGVGVAEVGRVASRRSGGLIGHTAPQYANTAWKRQRRRMGRCLTTANDTSSSARLSACS
jgi:hypothetical protein